MTWKTKRKPNPLSNIVDKKTLHTARHVDPTNNEKLKIPPTLL